MRTLNCGCEIAPGAPVSKETVKAHKEHTLHAMFFWDLLVQHAATQEYKQARDKLMMARIAYQEALDAAYPD